MYTLNKASIKQNHKKMEISPNYTNLQFYNRDNLLDYLRST